MEIKFYLQELVDEYPDISVSWDLIEVMVNKSKNDQLELLPIVKRYIVDEYESLAVDWDMEPGQLGKMIESGEITIEMFYDIGDFVKGQIRTRFWTNCIEDLGDHNIEVIVNPDGTIRSNLIG